MCHTSLTGWRHDLLLVPRFIAGAAKQRRVRGRQRAELSEEDGLFLYGDGGTLRAGQQSGLRAALHENSRDGYVIKESLSIQNLIERRIILESDLTEL